MTEQIATHESGFVPIMLANNVFCCDCPVFKFESEVAALCFKHGLTLKEAIEEAYCLGFTTVTLAQIMTTEKQTSKTTANITPQPTPPPSSSSSIPQSTTTSDTSLPSSLSLPKLLHTSKAPSSTTSSPLLVPSVSLSNPFEVLNSETPSSTSLFSCPSLPKLPFLNTTPTQRNKCQFGTTPKANNKFSPSKFSQSPPVCRPPKRTLTAKTPPETMKDIEDYINQPFIMIPNLTSSPTSSHTKYATVHHATAEVHNLPSRYPSPYSPANFHRISTCLTFPPTCLLSHPTFHSDLSIEKKYPWPCFTTRLYPQVSLPIPSHLYDFPSTNDSPVIPDTRLSLLYTEDSPSPSNSRTSTIPTTISHRISHSL
ncbi:salivary glue protein Sgs-3-like [Macrobrachium rosenbergii]|uniref:salivary glue protein Sgs-3-like n=1 Tax=Macrobrachium rosenbergii TaxID=79674 RepID=UPI0034D3C57D